MDDITLFGRYAKVGYSLSGTMVEVLGFTFVETASQQFLFPGQQSSRLMHSSPNWQDCAISSRDGTTRDMAHGRPSKAWYPSIESSLAPIASTHIVSNGHYGFKPAKSVPDLF